MSKEESKPPIELDNIILSDSKVVCNNYRDPECFMIGVGWGTAKTFLYYESKLSELRKENEELKAELSRFKKAYNENNFKVL